MKRGPYKRLVRTSRMPAAPCPVCGAKLDAVSGSAGPTNSLSTWRGAKPRPDDLTMCIYCKTFLIFTADFGLRLATQEEIDELSPTSRSLYAHMMRER